MDLPLSVGLWIAAAAPLLVVLVLLIGLRWRASSAASVGYFLALLAAMLLFGTSLQLVALQSVKGVWDALLIAYVIVPALLLYEISDEAGAFRAIRRGIEALTPNTLLHILAFGWVFPSFLQGVTGFGAPIAVAAPLLLAVGVKPLWAVTIPIIGHAWGKTFGTLGVAWDALARVTPIDDPGLALAATCMLLGVANLLAILTIAWWYGGARGIREAAPAMLVIVPVHGLGQLAVSQAASNLAVVVPAAVALLATLLLARTVYAKPSRVRNSRVMQADRGADNPIARPDGSDTRDSSAGMPLWLAFGPYVLLTMLILAAEMLPFIGEPLATVRLGLAFPEMQTTYGVTTAATSAHGSFAPLTHPGTFVLVCALLAYSVFRLRGHIPRGRIDEIAVDTLRTSIPTVAALMAFIPLALVMEGSGMVLELAAGLAQVASPVTYALLSPVVGAFGGFLTGSNLSANILFGPLQSQAAAALELNASLVLAAQTAGAAIGSSIAISAVLLGLGAVGAPGQAGVAMRTMLPYVLLSLLAMALLTLGGAWLMPAAAAQTAGAG